MLDAGDEMLARAYGPVWAGLPQTPQAAEYCAYAAALQFLNGPAVLHGDCLNVVRDANRPLREALDRNRPHAGILKDTLKFENRKFAQQTVKVKAHVCELGEEARIADPVARRHARGNNLADKAAKDGLSAHTGLEEWQSKAVFWYLKNLEKVAMVIAKTCALWPRASGHNSRTPPAPTPRLPADTQRGDVGAGHSIRVYEGSAAEHLIVCANCGATCSLSKVSSSLQAACAGRPSNDSSQGKRRVRCLNAIARGRHPSGKGRIGNRIY